MNVIWKTIIWQQFGAAIDMPGDALRACPECQATIEALTDETAQKRCRFEWGELTFLELLLYNMRHVQEHASQLSLILGQKVGSAPHPN